MTPKDRIESLHAQSEAAEQGRASELYTMSLRRWWWIDLGLKAVVLLLASVLAGLIVYSLVAAWAWYFGGSATPKPSEALPAPSLRNGGAAEPAVQLRPALEAGEVVRDGRSIRFAF